jgi:acyl carrier protein
MSDIKQKIKKIIFDHAPSTSATDEKLELNCSPDWDSMAHFLILLSIEKEFNFKFSADEMETVKSFSDILQIVNANIADG